MKRWLIIGFGLLLIFILVAIWGYLLFFATTPPEERFANFDFGTTTEETPPPPPTPTSTEPTATTSDLQDGGLQQLTVDPVIGYQAVSRATTSETFVYYVAGGTGHIFRIDLETGAKERISNTTIPLSRAAAITPNGQYVMTQAGEGLGREFTVGTLDESSGSQRTVVLDEVIEQFTTSAENTFLYTVQTERTTLGREYDPATRQSRTLFTIPFREAVVQWGESANGAHLVYPKPSGRLEGYLYEVVDGQLERLPIAGFGLSAIRSGDLIYYARQIDGEYRTYQYNSQTAKSVLATLTFLPEKCAGRTMTENQSVQTICGLTFSDLSPDFPDDWYRGEVIFEDVIWSIESGSASQLQNTQQSSGRMVDMIGLQYAGDTQILFLNRLDNTLWLFDWRDRFML